MKTESEIYQTRIPAKSHDLIGTGFIAMFRKLVIADTYVFELAVERIGF